MIRLLLFTSDLNCRGHFRLFVDCCYILNIDKYFIGEMPLIAREKRFNKGSQPQVCLPLNQCFQGIRFFLFFFIKKISRTLSYSREVRQIKNESYVIFDDNIKILLD